MIDLGSQCSFLTSCIQCITEDQESLDCQRQTLTFNHKGHKGFSQRTQRVKEKIPAIGVIK